jgi:hypothetical protein
MSCVVLRSEHKSEEEQPTALPWSITCTTCQLLTLSAAVTLNGEEVYNPATTQMHHTSMLLLTQPWLQELGLIKLVGC